ncbi:hypothetical protein MMC12_000374 [Toensbergia leucococca]|nr:hypothetical protein [Toensbergia leucococca]
MTSQNHQSHERSYGIIPLSSPTSPPSSASTKILLIHQKTYRSGLQWSIPKGHAEASETPLETAKRELFEETGLKVKQLVFEGEDFVERYTNPEKGWTKEVVYFAGVVEEGEVRPQESEVEDWRWCELGEAVELATFEDARRILRKVVGLLENEPHIA